MRFLVPSGLVPAEMVYPRALVLVLAGALALGTAVSSPNKSPSVPLLGLVLGGGSVAASASSSSARFGRRGHVPYGEREVCSSSGGKREGGLLSNDRCRWCPCFGVVKALESSMPRLKEPVERTPASTLGAEAIRSSILPNWKGEWVGRISRPEVREARAPVGRMEDAVAVVSERAMLRVVENAFCAATVVLIGDGDIVEERGLGSVARLRCCWW